MSNTNPLEPSKSTIKGKKFDRKPLKLSVDRTSKNICLVQPAFLLSEADFLRLKSHGNILYRLGEVVLIFGISFGLSHFDEFKSLIDGQSANPSSSSSLWITGGCAALGIVLIILSYVFSPTKQKVIKKIAGHFRDNPGKAEARMEKQ